MAESIRTKIRSYRQAAHRPGAQRGTRARPEAQQLYEVVTQIAAYPAAPTELRALARTLQRLMIGDAHVNLSALPAEWVEVIR